jgi:hypothetical protein
VPASQSLRGSTDEDDDGACCERSLRARANVCDRDLLDVAEAFESAHLVAEQDLERGIVRYPFKQVARHGACQRVPTDHEVDVATVLAERERRLPGRVSATDDNNSVM